MDQNIESGKSDSLNKTLPIDQLASIKWSKQSEKQLVVELEAIVLSHYTISGSFPTGFILHCKIKHLNIKIIDFYIFRLPPSAFTINVPANGCSTSKIFQIILASIRSN